jgi:transposase InsO family protein
LRAGTSNDNAVMEAFFSTLKTELADHFDSHSEAKRELFDYIDAFYNTRRRHSAIDYVSPAGRIRATLLVRQERAMRVMVDIAAIASIRKPRRMPQERF